MFGWFRKKSVASDPLPMPKLLDEPKPLIVGRYKPPRPTAIYVSGEEG